MTLGEDPREEILRFLEREDLTFELTGSDDQLAVGSSSGPAFLHQSVFTVPPDLIAGYLVEMSKRFADEPDPMCEALALTKIHAMEYLTTDHGNGLNATTALGFRRNTRGQVEFYVGHNKAEPVVPPEPDQLEWVADLGA